MATRRLSFFNWFVMATALSAPLAVQAQPANPLIDTLPKTGIHETAPQGDPVAIYKEAGINDEQETKIRDIAKAFEDQQKNRIKQMMVLLKQLKDLSLNPSPDESQVLATQEEINRQHDEIATERTKLMLKIRYILTPEQRQKLVTIVKKPPTHPTITK